jgi:hypothetical protein
MEDWDRLTKGDMVDRETARTKGNCRTTATLCRFVHICSECLMPGHPRNGCGRTADLIQSEGVSRRLNGNTSSSKESDWVVKTDSGMDDDYDLNTATRWPNNAGTIADDSFKEETGWPAATSERKKELPVGETKEHNERFLVGRDSSSVKSDNHLDVLSLQ